MFAPMHNQPTVTGIRRNKVPIRKNPPTLPMSPPRPCRPLVTDIRNNSAIWTKCLFSPTHEQKSHLNKMSAPIPPIHHPYIPTSSRWYAQHLRVGMSDNFSTSTRHGTARNHLLQIHGTARHGGCDYTLLHGTDKKPQMYYTAWHA